MSINLPSYMSEKDSLVYVKTFEEDMIHQSWKIDDNVIVYENIPGNYPSTALAVFDSMDDYIDSIKDVSWINEKEYIIKNNMEDYGFPYEEE